MIRKERKPFKRFFLLCENCTRLKPGVNEKAFYKAKTIQSHPQFCPAPPTKTACFGRRKIYHVWPAQRLKVVCNQTRTTVFENGSARGKFKA
jgi:hypothetical protein